MASEQGRSRRFTTCARLLAAFFLLGLTRPAHAQTVSEIRCQRYSIEAGLSQSSGECILQDRRGFMWFGTEDGLNRFDGYSFLVHRPRLGDSRSLSLSNITALIEDSTGLLWIGTFNGGLDCWNQMTGEWTHYSHRPADPGSISHNFIRAICEDRNGDIWVGTEGGGLNHLDRKSGRFTVFRHRSYDQRSLSHDSVRAVLVDRDGTLWVGTNGGGLNLFDRNRKQFFSFQHIPLDEESLSNDNIRALLDDGAGNIWIGTFGGGLNRLEKESQSFTIYTHDPRNDQSISSNLVNALLQDGGGRIWAGTTGGGLNCLEPKTGRFQRFVNDPNTATSLSSNEIHSLYQDRTGMIWMGTYGGGICQFNGAPKPFATYRSRADSVDGLGNDIVFAIYEDRDGLLWIGSNGGGLDRLNRRNQTWGHYRNRPEDPFSLSHNVVRVIFEDRSGEFWIGTNGGGVNRWDRKGDRFTVYRHERDDPTTLSHNEIRSIRQDSRGYIWVGTHGGGLNRIDPETGVINRFRHNPIDPNSLGGDIIRSIFEDTRGRLWIATYGGGLDRYDPSRESFLHHRAEFGVQGALQTDFLFSITEDAAGNLWLGSWGGGLICFQPDQGTFTHFTIADGLPGNSVYGVLQDRRGFLWVSSPNGLFRFDPRTRHCKNYSEWDGLQSIEFNGGAYFQSSTGEMFFGGIRGFNAFFPERITDNPHIPPLAITSVKKLNREFDPGIPMSALRRLTFSRRDYFFSLEFSALDFTIPAKNRYAYKMEGVDPDWVQTDASQRMATYTNLSPGWYRFRVKGSNNDDVWNQTGVSLQVYIRPAFWQTIWFRGALLLLVLGVTYYFNRRHLENVRLKTELSAAHDAQMSIMPQRDPVLEGLQVSALCIPASEIGGDFFDYIWLDQTQSRFGIVVADVSGKAMKAAMTALLTSGMIYSRTDEAGSISEIVTSLNRTLFRKTERKMFTALCLAAIDLHSREFSFVNAGLNELIRKREGRVELIKRKGERLPLGVSDKTDYEEQRWPLLAGDVLLLYTDGLTDAQNEKGDFFDTGGVLRGLEEIDTNTLSAREIKEALIQKVKKFAGEGRPQDDITLVVIKVTAVDSPLRQIRQ